MASLAARSSPLALLALLAACTGAQVKPRSAEPSPEVVELQGQLRAQSTLISEQQRRLEQLEMRLAALSAKLTDRDKQQPAAPAPRDAGRDPVETARPLDGAAETSNNPLIEFDGPKKSRRRPPDADDPRQKLQTVKLEPAAPAKGRRLRRNPVDRAPRLPTATSLHEPDEGDLEKLAEQRPARTSAPAARATPDSDAVFARAVQRLNEGDRAGAYRDLLAFAARHPQHAAADNAIYLAGLARTQEGDCAGGLVLFARVSAEYPAGDAVPSAQLEAARCLIKLQRNEEAKANLAALENDHPDVPEATQARALLNGLQ